jgi:carnitine O-acetyltransferase
MHQYTQLFGFTRVPQHGCDRLVYTPFPSPSKYIVLIIDDQLFKIDVYSKDNKRLLDGDLER